ncbi:putative bifunctional diguanylate cyclase/phosphodiesterase [Marinobacter salexigens]|uniref:putative bifunctional diguanylate cyclase/phosphodiesterase n=1 Tax=Marinobacter salexigens TaxID=1925763 RepID=UPI000C282D78|nr:EAL domain-containing protein [Marinobacter salexigens]
MPSQKGLEHSEPPPKVDLTRLSLVASTSRNMIMILGDAGAIQWVNPSFRNFTGFLLTDIIGTRPSKLLGGSGTDPNTLRRIARQLHRAEQYEEEILLYTSTGHPFWVHVYGVPIGKEQGVAPGFIVIMNNISDHKHSERGLLIAASVFDRSHEAIIITDQNNRIIDVNPSFSRITGYSRSDVLGLNPSILSSGRHSPAYYRSMWKTIEEKGFWRGEIWNRRKNGEEYVELQTISRIHLEEPGSYYHVANFTDITELKNHAKDIERAANYDHLTGLPNLQLLKERLHQAQIHADTHETSLSVGYVDLDGFQAINANFGTDAGDKILRVLAGRFAQRLRSGDTVARIGGDEFGLILQSENHEAIYDRILSTITEPIDLGNDLGSVTVSASLGITRYPSDSADAEGLIRHADQAVYMAKDKGRNLLHVFDPELNEHRRQKRAQLIELSRALDNREFELYFQPQVRIEDCKVIGFEALIRWNHPHKGLLYPDTFLPSLEGSHLEVPLGQWVLEEAVYQMGLWHAAGEDLSVSINISPRHLMDRSFALYLESFLNSHPAIKPGQITLEVLESTSLEDIKRASDVLARCQALGFRAALDDFGTGFSSLSYISTLPIDLVKIEKSFVINMLKDSSDRAIVESVIFMGQRFNHPILAEGVESMEHARALRDLGCEYMQGYGVSRPMQANCVPEWVRQWRENHSDPSGPARTSDSGW